MLPAEQPCFVVDELRLVGPDAKRFHWLMTPIEGLRGVCIGPSGVASIARHLTRELVEQGYVTSRVSVGPQALGDGVLSIRLHVGRVAAVRLIDSSTGQDDERRGGWRNAFPLDVGQVLDVRDLEQGVEQMQRLASQTVTTTLEPGQAADTTIVTIARRMSASVETGPTASSAGSGGSGRAGTPALRGSPGLGSPGDRLRGGVTLDNAGTAALGRAQSTLSASIDNPLAINDMASVSLHSNASRPSSDHRSQGASFDYGVPFGYGLLGVGVSHSRFAQYVPLTTTQVLSRGESDTTAVRWDQVAWRTAGSKARVFSELSTRSSSSFLDDLELASSRRRATFVEIGASFQHGWQSGSTIDVSLSRKHGEPWLGAQGDLAPEAGSATLRPRLWLMSASASVPITLARLDLPASSGAPTAAGAWPGDTPTRAWRFDTAWRGQTTASRTTVIDQFAIGSRGSVRGFDGRSALLAENGWAWRNEVRAAVDVDGSPGWLYLAVDVGRVWGPSDLELVGHRLVGAAVGWRGQWRAARFDLALATPLSEPDGFRTARLNAYFSASFAF